MIVTVADLRRIGACTDQVERFRSLFGESVEVTRELCLKHASAFDWDWAAGHILPTPARAEYERARAPAWAEYERATAAAQAECERARAAAFADAAQQHGEVSQ